jgi:hypothetical protein
MKNSPPILGGGEVREGFGGGKRQAWTKAESRLPQSTTP